MRSRGRGNASGSLDELVRRQVFPALPSLDLVSCSVSEFSQSPSYEPSRADFGRLVAQVRHQTGSVVVVPSRFVYAPLCHRPCHKTRAPNPRPFVSPLVSPHHFPPSLGPPSPCRQPLRASAVRRARESSVLVRILGAALLVSL